MKRRRADKIECSLTTGICIYLLVIIIESGFIHLKTLTCFSTINLTGKHLSEYIRSLNTQ